jgi:tetratricopeptide (TPR) repeat protein
MANELHDAAAQDDQEACDLVIKLIEEEHCDINALHSEHHTRPIEFAAQSGSLATFRELLKRKAVIDASQSEQNILDWVVENSLDVIEYVTDPRNNIIPRLNDRTTALHVAAFMGWRVEAEKLIAENPSCINAADIHDRTAVYWAARRGKQSMVHYLTNHPAFKDVANRNKFDSSLRGSATHAFKLGFFYLNQDGYEGNAIEQFKDAICSLEQLVSFTGNDCYSLQRAHADLGVAYIKIRKFKEATSALNKAKSYIENISYPKDKANELERILHHQDWILQKEPLDAEAALWGFECKDVPADGNCFFHAVVHVMKLDHKELRLQTVQHIRKHLDFYKPFINTDSENAESYYKTAEDYIAYLENSGNSKKPGGWIDHIAILAFSRAFNVTVAIINSDGSEPLVFKRADPDNILYLGREVGLHYLALDTSEEYVPEKFIGDYIEKAHVDDFNKQSPIAKLSSQAPQALFAKVISLLKINGIAVGQSKKAEEKNQPNANSFGCN